MSTVYCHLWGPAHPARSAQKGNFLGPAAKEGIAILFPDTSPRGAGIEGETDSWDFGVGVSPPPSPSPSAVTDAGTRRRGILRERDEPEVGEALQHAHARHARAPAGARDEQHPCRAYPASLPLIPYRSG